MQAARGASLNPSEPTEPVGPTPARGLRFQLVFWGVALLGVLVDQSSKVWAEETLSGRGTVKVAGDFFGWHLTHNPGAAFSMGTTFTEALSVIAICAVVVVLYFARRLGSTGWALGLGFLLAGVAGNLIDRLTRDPGFLRGHVVDFMALPHWPIFNVADVCINVAAAIIVIQTIRGLRLDGTRHD
ncbi:MAG: signal peptidase II [Nocardioides sp.]|nr:signal peptidase II [Nocardioides sp.]